MSNFDMIDTLTKTYFSIIMKDREYLEQELDSQIPQSNCYKKFIVTSKSFVRTH